MTILHVGLYDLILAISLRVTRKKLRLLKVNTTMEIPVRATHGTDIMLDPYSKHTLHAALQAEVGW